MTATLRESVRNIARQRVLDKEALIARAEEITVLVAEAEIDGTEVPLDAEEIADAYDAAEWNLETVWQKVDESKQRVLMFRQVAERPVVDAEYQQLAKTRDELQAEFNAYTKRVGAQLQDLENRASGLNARLSQLDTLEANLRNSNRKHSLARPARDLQARLQAIAARIRPLEQSFLDGSANAQLNHAKAQLREAQQEVHNQRLRFTPGNGDFHARPESLAALRDAEATVACEQRLLDGKKAELVKLRELAAAVQVEMAELAAEQLKP